MHSDKDLPAVALPVEEDHAKLWGKTREAYRYVWDRYRDQVDWFMKAYDDTSVHHFYTATSSFNFWATVCFVNRYVIVENLRYMLLAYNSSMPLCFGHKFKKSDYAKQGFFSGGAGDLS